MVGEPSRCPRTRSPAVPAARQPHRGHEGRSPPVTASLFVLASVSALRGVWSPCGLSMLSTITPIAERARGHRYGRSAAWFLLGATIGGATLGTAMGLGALLSRAAGLAGTPRTGLSVAVTAVCLAADARLLGLRLPDRPRQVDASWVGRLRPWAYAGGFGWQLGTGLSTYVMTNATYTVILVGIVLLAPLTAVELALVYGVCRGATILVGAPVSSPARLATLHRWLAAADRPSVAATMVAQLAFLAVGVARLGSDTLVGLGTACSVVLLVACVVHLRVPSTHLRVGVS